jgi:hypothetical protein
MRAGEELPEAVQLALEIFGEVKRYVTMLRKQPFHNPEYWNGLKI